MGAGKFMLVNEPQCLAIRQFPLEVGVYLCGRASDCDLGFRHATISRRHAELRVAEAEIKIIDLASRNGTFVKGEPVCTAILRPGDNFRLGDVAFIVLDGDRADACDDCSESISTRRTTRHLRVPMLDARLSSAQNHVLDLVLQGLAEKEIAKRLDNSQHTVHNHIRHIYRSLGVSSRAELMAKFVRKRNSNGIAEAPGQMQNLHAADRDQQGG